MRRFIPAFTALAALAFASPAGAKIIELGVPDGQSLPTPSCPKHCQAVDQVTGYQVQIGDSKNPYLIHRRGNIVAFSIALGQPNAKQTSFFTDLFGVKPEARLSILKLGHHHREAKLVAQSEVFDLSDYLGSTPQFALSQPLRVRRRDVVALTVPTWAPAFAVNLGKDYAWRSSRRSSRCNAYKQQAAQETLGTRRRYGCFYRTAQLLYSATYIRDPKKTNTTGGK